MNLIHFEIKKTIALGPGGDRYVYDIVHKATDKEFGCFKEYQQALDRTLILERVYALGLKEGKEITKAIYQTVLFIVIMTMLIGSVLLVNYKG